MSSKLIETVVESIMKGDTKVFPLVNELKALVQKEKTTSLSGMLTGQGWTELNLRFNKSIGYYEDRASLVECLEEEIKLLPNLPEYETKSLKLLIKEFKSGKLKSKEKFIGLLPFKNLKGAMCYYYVFVGKRRNPDDGEIEHVLATSFIEGTFKKAIDYMVLTHTNKDWFGSETTVELVPRPSKSIGVTSADIIDILSILTKPLIEIKGLN
jgi:hypothetical protein